jgi:hypothetical protein
MGTANRGRRLRVGATVAPSARRLARGRISLIAERLLAAVASGSFSSFADLYAPNAAFEAHLPGRSVEARGPARILAELGMWFGGEGDVTFHSQTPASGGLTLRVERRDRATGVTARGRHLIHADVGGIRRHIVYTERPAEAPSTTPLPAPDDPLLASLVARVVRRTPLDPAISGMVVERLELADGSALFAKHLRPKDSWIMRATGDVGREASLWSSGTLTRVGEIVEHGVVGAVAEGGGWLLLMRDLSSALRGGADVTAAHTRRVLRAVDELHARFAGETVAGLCTLSDRLRLFSPATAERERDGEDLAPKVIGRGWELFAAIAPQDVVEAIVAIHERPASLAQALERQGPTLIHGDLRPANVGYTDEGVVLLDWGLSAWAPAALDLAWYLFNLSGPGSEFAREEVSRGLLGGRGAPAPEVVDLALLATLVQTGCYFGHRAVQDPDGGVRRRALEDLAWWVGRARAALGRWSVA